MTNRVTVRFTGTRRVTVRRVVASGPRGATGSPLSYKGELDSTDDLPDTGNQPSDWYSVEGHMWIWNGTAWVDSGPLAVGTPGPPGDIGPPPSDDDIANVVNTVLPGLVGDEVDDYLTAHPPTGDGISDATGLSSYDSGTQIVNTEIPDDGSYAVPVEALPDGMAIAETDGSLRALTNTVPTDDTELINAGHFNEATETAWGAALLQTQPLQKGGMPVRSDLLAPWISDLVASRSAIKDVVVIHDSIGALGDLVIRRPWPWLLGDILTRFDYTTADSDQYVPAKVTGSPSMTSCAGTAVMVTTGTDVDPHQTGVGGGAASLAAGQKATHTATMDAVTVVYTRGTGTQQLTIRDGVAGTVLTTLNLSGSAATAQMWTSGALTAGVHTIEIENTGAAAVVLEGVRVHRGTRTLGCRVWAAGHSGYTSHQFVDDPALALNLIDNLDPSLVIVATGINDEAADYIDDITAVIAAVRTKTDAPIALWDPYANPFTRTVDESVDARTLDLNVTLIDASTVLADLFSAPGFTDGGDLHPTALGQRALALHIASVLVGDPIGHLTRSLAGLLQPPTVTVQADTADSVIVQPQDSATAYEIRTLDDTADVESVITAAGVFLKRVADDNYYTSVAADLFGQPALILGPGDDPADTVVARTDVAEVSISTAGGHGDGALVVGTETIQNGTQRVELSPFGILAWEAMADAAARVSLFTAGGVGTLGFSGGTTTDVTVTRTGANQIALSAASTLLARVLRVLSAKTAGYTAVLGDANTTITFNSASPVAFTIPSSVTWLAGSEFRVVNLGAGLVTITAGGSTTLNGLATVAQHIATTVQLVATNTWETGKLASAIADITGLQAALDAKAALTGATFSGTLTVDDTTVKTQLSSSGVFAFKASADTTAVASMFNLAGIGVIALGPGGSTGTDWSIARTGVGTASLSGVLTAQVARPFVTAKTGNYTFVIGDAQKTVPHNSATGHTFTIPLNATVAYPVGTEIYVWNLSGVGVLTIAITATGTLTGTTSLAANTKATLLKVATDTWVSA